MIYTPESAAESKANKGIHTRVTGDISVQTAADMAHLRITCEHHQHQQTRACDRLEAPARYTQISADLATQVEGNETVHHRTKAFGHTSARSLSECLILAGVASESRRHDVQ